MKSFFDWKIYPLTYIYLRLNIRFASFIKTSDGYKVTAPEGFVAIDHVGKALKLVDRMEFSRANFTVAKSWT